MLNPLVVEDVSKRKSPIVNSNLLVLNDVIFASYHNGILGGGRDLIALIFRVGVPMPLPSEVEMSSFSKYILASIS